MFNREIENKFKLKTDRLPAMMGIVYQDGVYTLLANKTNVILWHSWKTEQAISLTMTWDEQLQLSTILEICDGTVFALCDKPNCNCGGIMLNMAIFESETGAIKLAMSEDKGLILSGDEDMCYIVMPDESQISICWYCTYRLKEFMSQVDSLYRGDE